MCREGHLADPLGKIALYRHLRSQRDEKCGLFKVEQGRDETLRRFADLPADYFQRDTQGGKRFRRFRRNFAAEIGRALAGSHCSTVAQ